MALHNETGREGEERAIHYLVQKGYRILCRNYRCGKAELDIIAAFDKKVIFIEVKTRTATSYGYPEESVSRKKRRLMVQAASQYMFENHLECECRFDIIAVIRSRNDEWHFTHFEDAFFLIADQ